jgi:hypothetical protein
VRYAPKKIELIIDLEVKKHWRGIAKIGVVVAGIAGGIACGATVVCGVAVAAIASAAFYSAVRAGTKQVSYIGLAETTLIGGALGGAGSAATGLLNSGAADINSVLDAGLGSAVLHPLVTAGTLAGGYLKTLGGTAGIAFTDSGALRAFFADRSGGR